MSTIKPSLSSGVKDLTFEMTDDAILQLIRIPENREEGFRQLVLKYQQRLYALIKRQVGSHEDTDDILQNTFLKIFRHYDRFEGRSELYTWMYTIAGNEIKNHVRSSKKMITELDDRKAGYAEGYMDSEKLSQTLEDIVVSLPERQQMVFRMRYYDGLPYKEIASLLQITEGSLKASYHHAVKKIEEVFRHNQIL